ncbi:uncharacterized protein VICG_00091 [Vittaforma corneae ATCC 50505]|uniref:RRM domain-containing protein n=1 Tax=Vittaforma corneae (strain ATCC 50505) TaxID=993615 RepID=L2GPL6_VITCO|nr:uncharacterized protein VICG_00091 [Vittaforma corneae ATCC 50505]ELA42776.1 hypothetical protein VICG_00091 [Vittaforma corneae ATCC 50505]
MVLLNMLICKHLCFMYFSTNVLWPILLLLHLYFKNFCPSRMVSIQHSKSLVTVRCGNLSPKTSIAELVALFSREPVAIEDIKMKKNDLIQSSYAFVTFLSIEDAKRIVEKYNYTTLHDREMTLMILTSGNVFPENANLFVKNIPKEYTTKKLYEIFKDFGSIASCKVSVDSNGESRGYGFVQYETVESADKAIADLRDEKFEGKTLSISRFDRSLRDQKHSDSSSSTSSFTNVFVKNFPSSLTEAKLKDILEKYGPICSIYLPLNEKSEPVGFACVNFEKAEDAAKAVENLHNKHIFSLEECQDSSVATCPFYIQKAERRKEREETIRKQLEALSLKGINSKNNLYIAHIPETFSEDEIRDLFSKFGTIVSIKLQKTSSENNKQFGYICFKTPEEAAAAFEAMDGTLLDNSKLRISFYKAKNERRAESTSGKPRSSNSESKEGLSSIGTSKLIQSLANVVERTASLYKKDWNVVGANNSTEFSQKMAREFFSVHEKELKEMVSSSAFLENKIKTILKNKKEKLSQKQQ